MATRTQQLQRIVTEYQRDGRQWPATTKEIAKWAVTTGRYDLTGPTLERQCARELAQAMGLEYFSDSHGRRVRAKHPARITKGGQQLVLWDDIRTAPRHHMQMAFQLRRRRIASECKQVKTDVDIYNGAHTDEMPIQMVLDFRRDVEEMELSEGAYSLFSGLSRQLEHSTAAVLTQAVRAE